MGPKVLIPGALGRHPRLRKAAFGAVAILVSLAGAELVFRLAAPPVLDVDLVVPRNPRSQLIGPNQGSPIVWGEEGDQYTAMLAADNPFYSSPDTPGPGLQRFPRKKAAGTLRLAVLGGSTSWGYLVKEAYPAMLATLVNAGGGGRIEVLNASKIACGSTELVRLLPDILSKFEPDIVLLEWAHNEGYDVSQRLLVRGPHGAWTKLLMDMLERSRLYSTLLQLLFSKPSLERFWAEESGGEDPMFVRRVWYPVILEAVKARLVHHLKLAKDLVRAAGARLVVITAPYGASDLHAASYLWNLFSYSASYDASQVRQMQENLNEAYHQLERGQLPAAERYLSAVEDRAHGQYWWLLGRLRAAQGRDLEAGKHFNRAMALLWRPSARLINPLLRRWTRAEGVMLVDLHRELLGGRKDGVISADYFRGTPEPDYIHPNSQGHRAMARGLEKALRTSGLLGSAGPLR